MSSAGVGALVDHPVDPGSVVHLEFKGIEHADFAARQISERMLDDVDLVLAMTVEHRRAVLSYAPRLLKRCFTLKEIARLIDAAEQTQPWTERLEGCDGPDERWARIPAELARERGRHRVDEGADDVADPYRRSQDHFDTMAREVDEAVETIVGLEARF